MGPLSADAHKIPIGRATVSDLGNCAVAMAASEDEPVCLSGRQPMIAGDRRPGVTSRGIPAEIAAAKAAFGCGCRLRNAPGDLLRLNATRWCIAAQWYVATRAGPPARCWLTAFTAPSYALAVHEDKEIQHISLLRPFAPAGIKELRGPSCRLCRRRQVIALCALVRQPLTPACACREKEGKR